MELFTVTDRARKARMVLCSEAEGSICRREGSHAEYMIVFVSKEVLR